MPQFDGKQGEHADIDAHLRLPLRRIRRLKSVGTTIFKSFKRLYRLEARRVGPAGQGAARLTPKNSRR
jgi:hypothetical protein